MPADVSDFRLIGPAPLAALRALDERSRILKGMIGWVGFRTIELPYNRTVRHAGSTKWNAAGLFNLAIESIVSFSRKPLRIFSLISFGLFVSSICYMLASLVAGSFDMAVSVTKCNTRGKVLHDYSLHPLDHRRARNANDHAYARRLAASHRPSSWAPTQHAESRGAAPVAAWAL